MLRLPEKVRPLLKRPLGKLFSDKKTAFDFVQRRRPSRLITVGDYATAEFLGAGFKPDIAVVDFRIMRSAVGGKIKRVINGYKVSTQNVKNPPATVTEELREALENAAPPTKIIVEGEEDLATLPAVLSAPLGSVVAYGQPGEGIVLVEVSDEKKREIEKILQMFE